MDGREAGSDLGVGGRRRHATSFGRWNMTYLTPSVVRCKVAMPRAAKAAIYVQPSSNEPSEELVVDVGFEIDGAITK